MTELFLDVRISVIPTNICYVATLLLYGRHCASHAHALGTHLHLEAECLHWFLLLEEKGWAEKLMTLTSHRQIWGCVLSVSKALKYE